MAMTQQDKIECKEIAREIIKEVILEHVSTCPHHQAFLVSKARLVGLITGVIAASGISSGAVTTVILKLL